ncbi:hypothetical protein ACJX0J_033850 [Zea mays]
MPMHAHIAQYMDIFFTPFQDMKQQDADPTAQEGKLQPHAIRRQVHVVSYYKSGPEIACPNA